MAASEFYEVGPLSQIAVNLFYGWGYNFYRRENQLRADDLLIRAKAGALLGDARASVEAAEAIYRRANIHTPSRANPFPDPAVIADAQALERLSAAIGGVEAQIRAQPTPESDRMSELYRRESDVLVQLGDCDQQLIGQSELLRVKLDRAAAAAILAALPALEDGLHAITETLRNRRAILLAPV